MKTIMRELSRGRFLGHPVHVMLVHFPAALFPFGFCMDVLGRMLNNGGFAGTAFYAYAAGTLGGVAALAAGAIDYFRIPPEDPVLNKASLHAVLNITWIFTFGILVGLRFDQYPGFQPAGSVSVILSGLVNLGMIVSNYLGGDLVIRHHLGISLEEKRKIGNQRPAPELLQNRN